MKGKAWCYTHTHLYVHMYVYNATVYSGMTDDRVKGTTLFRNQGFLDLNPVGNIVPTLAFPTTGQSTGSRPQLCGFMAGARYTGSPLPHLGNSSDNYILWYTLEKLRPLKRTGLVLGEDRSSSVFLLSPKAFLEAWGWPGPLLASFLQLCHHLLEQCFAPFCLPRITTCDKPLLPMC